MYFIDKQKEPDELIQYRKLKGASYENIPTEVKDEVRSRLLLEQGSTCAYCMCRISAENSKIEHWSRQNGTVQNDLNYKNLLLCCKGGDGVKGAERTCDTKKGSSTLKFSPSDPSHNINKKHKYTSMGFIRSDDVVFNEQLGKVLNLNAEKFVGGRAAIIEVVQKSLNEKAGLRNKDDIRKLRDKFKSLNGKLAFREYYGVALKYLENKL